jgi:hypothetical protein
VSQVKACGIFFAPNRINMVLLQKLSIKYEMSDQNKHIENNPEFKGLKVNEGIDHPGSFSDHSVKRFLQKRRNLLPVEEYVMAF